MPTSVFINLATKDLDRSKEFYGALGYALNEKFTDAKAACIVISETVYVMLLTEEFFQTFTEKDLVDATQATETINALSTDSREAVDMMLEKGLAAGGTEGREPQDLGFMYSRSLQDLDGHIWEYFWMDDSAAENGPPKDEQPA